MERQEFTLYLERFLRTEDVSYFVRAVNSFLGKMPVEYLDSKSLVRAAILQFLFLSGVDVECSVMTNRGRIDLVFSSGDTVYAVGVKIGMDPARIVKRLRTINAPERLGRKYRRIHLVGLSFDSRTKSIGDWKDETAAGSPWIIRGSRW